MLRAKLRRLILRIEREAKRLSSANNSLLSYVGRSSIALIARLREGSQWISTRWAQLAFAFNSRLKSSGRRPAADKMLALDGLDESDRLFFPGWFLENLLAESAREQQPDDFMRRLAHAFITVGQAETGVKYYRRAFDIKPAKDLHGLIFQGMLLSSSATNESLYRESLKWAAQWYRPATLIQPRISNTSDPTRCLKVGYVCHFFHNSVSRIFALPFIRAHDRNVVKVYCYSDAPPEEVARNVRSVAGYWRDTYRMSDSAFAELVRNDEIDILLEMNGHTIVNRYAALSQRLSPVQINFYNQASTCGIPNIDYTMIDAKIVSPEDEKHFTEKIYRLPHAYGAASFDKALFPEVAPPPVLRNNHVTFGSFGASHKVTEATLDLWCDVLKRVPNSRFFMKAGALTYQVFRDVYLKYFENCGVSKDRVIMEGWSEYSQMLKGYSDVDIALDTFPHNAGATTLEALWMGIPVVSLSGQRLCSRSGQSMLTNLGRPEWVAYSPAQYAEIAESLASEPQRLAEKRRSQREQMRQSVLCDVNLYARDMENAFRVMWRRWCEQQRE